MVQQLSTNTFGSAKWIVSSDATQGTHTTIASAITSASSGDTIFIRPGTYTENLTLKAGVNLTAFPCDGATGITSTTTNVTIIGKLTASYNGTVSISGVKLQTNSDNLITLTSATATLNIFYCYINVTNNTAIAMSASGQITLFNCNGNIGTTGIAYFAISAGALYIINGIFTNSGASTTASTASGGLADLISVVFANSITTSSNAMFNTHYSIYEGLGNATALTLNGTGGSTVDFSVFNSGSASAISIGTGASALIKNCEISSSNTNAITGLGTIQYGNLTFTSSSSVINTSTQTPIYTELGKYKASGQPSFSANLTSSTTNSTGDGTAFTIPFNNEFFDQGSNYNSSTGVFTAPDTRNYLFSTNVTLTSLGAAHTAYTLQLVTTGNTFLLGNSNPFVAAGGGATFTVSGSAIAPMTASDTASIVLTVFGGTKTVGVSSANANSAFSGTLIN